MKRSRLIVRQLEAFVLVAELSSFTETAERIALTTSAVSALIGKLELSIGAQLFERSTRRVSLTEAGRAFLPSARGVLHSLRDAELAAANLSIHPTNG
ncbi:LysR family transcriptional regulator [uncultured Parasphingorhabdus sp.]|uniref:LysR family transcriptional regulator n=1 Tax=uncultured Parasphingorhabdus sp. TaxID=2709694 RepID=UPI0030DA48A0|tara:strand:- start:7183 stop:7476 length:294 start_codon:yes stop_codon:yes gene_type:complete